MAMGRKGETRPEVAAETRVCGAPARVHPWISPGFARLHSKPLLGAQLAWTTVI